VICCVPAAYWEVFSAASPQVSALADSHVEVKRELRASVA
jgi:hypothetical protein